jgi:hypothetical protein
MKTFCSQQEHERKTPYIAVDRITNEIHNSFSTRKVAKNWVLKTNPTSNIEITTRKKFKP